MALIERMWLDIHAHNALVPFLFFILHVQPILDCAAPAINAAGRVLSEKRVKREEFGIVRRALETALHPWLLLPPIAKFSLLLFIAFLLSLVLPFLPGTSRDSDIKAFWEPAGQIASKQAANFGNEATQAVRKIANAPAKPEDLAKGLDPRSQIGPALDK
jgi:hypothetical protein